MLYIRYGISVYYIRKESFKRLCHICDYASNCKSDLNRHLAIYGIGERYKYDQCNNDCSQQYQIGVT